MKNRAAGELRMDLSSPRRLPDWAGQVTTNVFQYVTTGSFLRIQAEQCLTLLEIHHPMAVFGCKESMVVPMSHVANQVTPVQACR